MGRGGRVKRGRRGGERGEGDERKKGWEEAGEERKKG